MTLIAHPFDTLRLGNFLLNGLESDATGFAGAAAFARRSGIGYLAAALHNFGVQHPLQLTIGVDLLGTSKEALELLLESAADKARLFVFHNPNATFHPKVFRFEYHDRWEVYTGSGNLTRGGLFANYEVGLVATLDRNVPADVVLNQRFDAEFARWSDVTSGTVQPLSDMLVKQLVDSGLVVPERAIRAAQQAAHRAAAPATTAELPFTAAETPAAPPLPAGRSAVVVARAAPVMTFAMTLEQADAADTPGRSPEFFIPKRARDMRPQFWGWPAKFVRRGGAMNRYDTPFRFRGVEEPSTLFGYADRAEFRLRNRAMRDAAEIGDILRIRHDEANADAVYEVDIVRRSSPEHISLMPRLTERAQSSRRRYGYY